MWDLYPVIIEEFFLTHKCITQRPDDIGVLKKVVIVKSR